MLKASLRFYQYNRKMTREAVLSVLIGMLTLVVALLIIRGSLMTEYEDGSCGNYNFIALNISDQEYHSMVNNPIFSYIGCLREEGTVIIGEEAVNLVSADNKSIDIYHQKCLKGRFPEEKNEIAAPEDFFTKLGINPKIGDTIELHPIVNGQESDCQYVICGILDNVERYWDNPNQSDFDYPEVFVGQKTKGAILCVLLTEFDDASKVYTFLEEKKYVYYDSLDKTNNDSNLISNAEDMSQDVIKDSMKTTKKGFESAILIPVFSLIISLLVMVLVFCSFKSLYQKRMKTFSLMSLWGMNKRTMMGLLVGESGVLVGVSILAGLILGIIMYQLLVVFQKYILGIPVESGLIVNDIIQAVTINPFVYAALVIFFSSLFSMIAVIGYLELPSVDGKRKNNKVRRRKKIVKTYDGQLRYLLRIKKGQMIIMVLIVSLIFTCIYFGSLYIYAKYNTVINSEKMELADLGLENLDYLAGKDFSLAQYETCALNRHDRGITEDNYNKLRKEKAVEDIQAVIEVPSMKIIQSNLSDKLSEYSVDNYARNLMDEFDELIDKTQKKHGYSLDEYKNMYNIPMLAAASDCIEEEFGLQVVSGSINADKINCGEEVILAIAEDGEEPAYKVGDKVHFTDLKIEDKEIEDYNFASRNIPEGLEPDFYYDYYYEETGDSVKQGAYAFGNRWDFEASIGAVVKIEDFYDDFYYTDNLMPEQAGFYFITSTDGLKQFGVSDHNYTKLGIKLKDNRTKKMEASFEKTWYSVCNANTDMKVVSSKKVKEKIAREQKSHLLIVLLLFIILILFSYLLIKAYVKIKKMECQDNIAILSYLGCRKYDITRIFLKILLLSETVAFFVGWITLYLYEKRLLNIYRISGSSITMKDLMEGNTGILWMTFEVSSQINSGGMENLFTYPYIKFYLASLFIEMVVIGIICILETKDIVFSEKRRKIHVEH